MTAVRRTPYAFFYLEDDPQIDIARILALAILSGDQHVVSPEDLALLRRLPAERWVPVSDAEAEAAESLVAKGLLVSDSSEPSAAALRERDEALSAQEWNLYAALYHYMTQWQGVEAPYVEGTSRCARRRERPHRPLWPATDSLRARSTMWQPSARCRWAGASAPAVCMTHCSRAVRHARFTPRPL